jgi:hypothetical protein
MGEIIYHPANFNSETGKFYDEKLQEHQDEIENQQLDTSPTQEQLDDYQKRIDEVEAKHLDITEEWKDFVDIFEHPDSEHPNADPNAKLDLDGDFKEELYDEALALNEDFLVNANYQFAEYLGLSMIQMIFDKNLESAEFVKIFQSDDSYQPALDEKLVATQKIVEEKVGFFSEAHMVF